jgi:hypothetical protein
MKAHLNISAAIAALFMSGCMTVVEASSIGRPLAAKAVDCVVKWENLDLTEAISRYELVGTVGVSSRGMVDVAASPRLREVVRMNACSRGADVVILTTNAPSPTGSGARVMLFRTRDGNTRLTMAP